MKPTIAPLKSASVSAGAAVCALAEAQNRTDSAAAEKTLMVGPRSKG